MDTEADLQFIAGNEEALRNTVVASFDAKKMNIKLEYFSNETASWSTIETKNPLIRFGKLNDSGTAFWAPIEGGDTDTPEMGCGLLNQIQDCAEQLVYI